MCKQTNNEQNLHFVQILKDFININLIYSLQRN